MTDESKPLYVNDKGDSVVANWSAEDLMIAFKIAEETSDDLLYGVVMNEVQRRNLKIVDP